MSHIFHFFFLLNTDFMINSLEHARRSFQEIEKSDVISSWKKHYGVATLKELEFQHPGQD